MILKKHIKQLQIERLRKVFKKRFLFFLLYVIICVILGVVEMKAINQKEVDTFKQNLFSLKKRSVDHFWNLHGKKLLVNHKDYSIISTFIEEMEFYFYSLLQFGYVNSSNISKVVRDFQGISYVEPLKNSNERIFALTTWPVISIHPDLGKYRNLSSKSFQQLIISHELGHIMNRSWKNESIHFTNELYQNNRVKSILKNMGLNSYDYLKEGFELLDEVIAQEIAEEVTYFKMNKKRPKREYRTDKAIFEYQPYLTNFNLYGEFQEVAIAFAKTLSFLNITTKDSDEVILQKLVKASFQNNFISLIKQEFINEGCRFDYFIMMLAIMGKMKSSTYQFVGLNQKKGSISIHPMIQTYYEIGKLNQEIQKTYTYVKR